MAISKITGNILADNLERSTDIMISANSYVLFKVSATANCVVLGGNTRFQENTIFNGDPGKLRITGDGIDLGPVGNIAITGGTSGQILSTDGSGSLSWVDSANVDALLGNTIQIGTPTDGDLTSNVAYDGWTANTVVTDGLDDLNQVSLNIANSTFVGQADFTGTPLAGPSPMAVDFTGTFIGNATAYLWDFGDGNTSTSQNPTNNYANTDGGQFTVTFTAYNPDGTYEGNVSLGAKGSVDSKTRTNYITLYTPTPAPSFTITDSTIDSGTAAEITNTSTNVTSSYELDWGDGAANVNPSLRMDNTYQYLYQRRWRYTVFNCVSRNIKHCWTKSCNSL